MTEPEENLRKAEMDRVPLFPAKQEIMDMPRAQDYGWEGEGEAHGMRNIYCTVCNRCFTHCCCDGLDAHDNAAAVVCDECRKEILTAADTEEAVRAKMHEIAEREATTSDGRTCNLYLLRCRNACI